MEEIKKQETRREEYIKWHIKKYGRPPNPNFFRGVSPSNSRSGSRTSNRSDKNQERNGSAKGTRGRPGGGLAAIKL